MSHVKKHVFRQGGTSRFRSHQNPALLHLRTEGIPAGSHQGLAKLSKESLRPMKHFSTFCVFTGEEKIT
jgi:hypothetical protein